MSWQRGLAVASAWFGLALGVGSAQGEIISPNALFDIQTKTGVAISDPNFLYAAPGATSPSPDDPIPWTTVMADISATGTGPVTPDTQDFGGEVPQNPWAFTQYSTLMGVIEEDGNPADLGVVLLLDESKADDILGNLTSWTTLFPSYRESDIVSALQTSDSATLLDFFTHNLALFPTWTPFGSDFFTINGTLVGFSVPADLDHVAGLLDVSAVPEPASIGLVGVFATALSLGAACRSRRRSLRAS